MVNPETLTVAKLKVELEKLGLPTNGLKAVLVARLKEALAGGGGDKKEAAADPPAPPVNAKAPTPKQSPAEKKQKAVKSPDPKSPPKPSPAKGRGRRQAETKVRARDCSRHHRDVPDPSIPPFTPR